VHLIVILPAQDFTMRILIAPLNWGLGHATRCIPLIERYIKDGAEVTLASDGEARSLLLAEFPLLECHELPGYGITYPKDGNAMVTSMASQIPRLTARVTQEKKWLDTFLVSNPQEMILSDSRYGLFSSKVRSVVLCHQTRIRSPRMAGILNAVHARLLNRFDELWIPDDEQRTLSGELSSLVLKIPIKCIGALSRFDKGKVAALANPVIAVVSGPEPQRSMFEALLLPVLKDIPGAILVRGVMSDDSDTIIDGMRVVGHVLREELELLVNGSELVICRSGYSSVMDLYALNKLAILIPTPGQTEQEYLAERLSSKEEFSTLRQNEIEKALGTMIRDLTSNV
jgi:UDP:flavonoid glycosyltransferase YjiC (YdhE family)